MTDLRHPDPPPRLLLDVGAVVDGPVAQVVVVGDVELSSIPQLEDPIRRLLARHRLSQLILDLRRATFLDSTGLRLLSELDREACNAPWRLIIVRGPDPVQRESESVRLHQRLQPVNDPAVVIRDDSARRQRDTPRGSPQA